MQHPRTFQPEYTQEREKLGRSQRMRLGLVEDEIADNPDSGLAKSRREDRGYCYETKLKGLIIEYRLLESGWVSFERLLNLGDPGPLVE